MKTKNRFLSILIALVMVLTMLPTTFAVSENYGDFTVTGDDLSGVSFADNVLTVNTSAAVTISNTDPNTATDDRIVVAKGIEGSANITLSGVNINAATINDGDNYSHALDLKSDTDITLMGENILKASGDQHNRAIYSFGCHITVDGSGSLDVEVTGSLSNGIAVNSLTVNGGNLDVTGPNSAISVDRTLTVNGGTVTATGASVASGSILASGGAYINGGTVTATGSAYGIATLGLDPTFEFLVYSPITFSGANAKLYATGTTGAIFAATPTVADNFTVTGSADANAAESACTETPVFDGNTYKIGEAVAKTVLIMSCEHTWDTDWSSNDTHHWHEPTCTCGTTFTDEQKYGYGVHSPLNDDGDCTTAELCVCGKEAVAARTEHTFDDFADLTCNYCSYTAVPYTVTLDANGGTVSPGTLTTNRVGNISSLPTPTKDGYEFMGWYMPNDSTQVNTAIRFSEDTVITAKWLEMPEKIDGYYHIYNLEQFEWFQREVNSKGETEINGKLMADIVLNDGTFTYENGKYTYTTAEGISEKPLIWAPIGTPQDPYAGTFDGNNHTLFGFFSGDDSELGLFSHISGATIRNLTVENGYVGGYSYLGGIAGYAENSRFENCHNKGGFVISNFRYIGGIAGYAEDTVFINCSNSSYIETALKSYSSIGGIVGSIRLSESIGGDTTVLSNCVNSGDVMCISKEQEECVGGIVGSCYGYSYNDTQYDLGLYDKVTTNDATVSIKYTAIIDGCKNSGNVTSYEIATGGIVGYGEVVLIKNCSNSGDIMGLAPETPIDDGSTGITPETPLDSDVPGGSEVGGIAGMLTSYCSVSDCHNTGDITGVTMVGGVVGGIYALYSDSNVTVENCTNSGTVTATLTAATDENGDYDPDKITDPSGTDSYYTFSHVASAGGIVGLAMDSCYSGEENAKYLGGDVLIRDCANSGTVTAENAPAAGGIAGYLCGAQVKDCCSTGTVTSTDEDATGLFAGYLFDNNHTATVSGDNDSTGHLFTYSDESDTHHKRTCICEHEDTEEHVYGNDTVCDLCGHKNQTTTTQKPCHCFSPFRFWIKVIKFVFWRF